MCKESILTALLPERKKEIPPALPVDKDLSVAKSSPHFFSLFCSVGGKAFRAAGAQECDPHFCKGANPFHLGRKYEEENPSHSLHARCPGHSGRSGAQSSAFLERAREPTVSSKGSGTSLAFRKEGESPPFSLSAFPSLLKRSLTIFW